MNPYKRVVACLLITSTTLMGLPSAAHAGLISTQELVAALESPVQGSRDKVASFLSRADVLEGLEAQGVPAGWAHERVQAMTDTEVEQLALRVDQAPAGGSVLGLMFTVFIVLLVTDILGLTKIFPFTRSVR